MEGQTPARDGPRRLLLPAILIVVTLVATVFCLRGEGRIWWCACGEWALWKSDVWTSHCSQHVADPYTISHISHGLLFWCFFSWLADGVGRRRFPAAAGRFTFAWRLFAAILAAAVWEVAENSTYVIERYRTVTMSLDYMGDSITNATCDVLFCGAGFFIAQWLKMKWTLLLFVAFEIILLVTIKDNLTLNVIMLVWPVEAIKQWQTAGHVVPAP